MTVEEAIEILRNSEKDRKLTQIETEAAWMIFNSVTEEEWAIYWAKHEAEIHAGENI